MLVLFATTAAYYISNAHILALLVVLLCALIFVLFVVVKVKGHPFRKFCYFLAFAWFLSSFLYVFLYFLDRNFIDDFGYVNPPPWAIEKTEQFKKELKKDLARLGEEIAHWREEEL